MFICEGQPEWEPQYIWEWGEYTIPSHNAAYPFCWISRWPLHTETRRHLHFTLRAVTMETTQRISWWMLHITFCTMSKLRACVERVTKTEEHEWLTAWAKRHSGSDKHETIYRRISIIIIIIMVSELTLGLVWSLLPDGWSQTQEVGPRTSTCLAEALHSQDCKTKHSYWSLCLPGMLHVALAAAKWHSII